MPAETTAARSSSPVFGPLRAFLRFIFAVLYFFLARLLAQHGARGLVSPDWTPLVEQGMFAFLLLFGYAGIGFSLDRQLTPLSQQGWPVRKGWLSETGMGLAFGWAIAVACVLPMVVFGGIVMHLSLHLASFGWLAVDAAYFAFAALAMQIAFRGYPFQCAIRVVGEPSAALIMAVLYGILNVPLPESSHASMAVNVVLGLLLAMAYLRTRALWLPLGLQLGWTASRALLFGLPVMGVSSHSPVVQGDPLSPYWMSGGDFGLDGSWLSFAVILIALPLVYSATSDLSFIHNAPVLEPAGLPVDLDAAAKRQHEAATRPDQPEIKPLVQILPLSTPASVPPAPEPDRTLNPAQETGDSPA